MKKIVVGLLVMFSSAVFGQYNCQSTKHAPTVQQSVTPINYNSRSDTADLEELKLDINTTGFSNEQLSGKAAYQIGVKTNFSKLRFDLLGFTVDSVISATGPLSFIQKGEHLIITHNATAGSILNWYI